MPHSLNWLVLLAPALSALPVMLPGISDKPRRFADCAIVAAAGALVVALVAAICVAVEGAFISDTVGVRAIGLAIYVDTLTAVMLLLVSFVGLVVIRFSRNYLAGDPGQTRFTKWLCLTLASVLTVILSGHLAMLIAAWMATSYCLNKLLLFYSHRPAALRAARKKFVISRIGDCSLITAAFLLYAQFGTLQIEALLAIAKSDRSIGATSAYVTIAALLIVATAILKSAQLPTHGWLLEVMETPTPVSALLHAGIINAGGYLILRLADVMLLAVPALEVLAVVGGATAVFGSLVMLTQTSVKVQLAYSTIAQMGFMLLQCGLGSFSAALLHILAHSLYKAHAFLSSGSIVDLARVSWSPNPTTTLRSTSLMAALAAAVGATFGIAFLFHITLDKAPGQLVFGSVLAMGLVQLLVNASSDPRKHFVIARSALAALLVAISYFALQLCMHRLTASSLPVEDAIGGVVVVAIATLVILSFAAVICLQHQMARHSDETFWIAAYAHLRNGLYLNTVANRLVLRFWPRRPTDEDVARSLSPAQ